ncbi:hypothetical protein M378DRAFT_814909 [Amanita muscaria Koide BX008]|uniref:Uncharacterized protein n=1 Tax=Amanita muscaria (strain Koide BX008) TaxID=946122 RepID=A0A0C2VZT7_AMAMK|nr:hypothetical protein M378DRAFT_814909 [Amanita muscaria Koide BX008]
MSVGGSNLTRLYRGTGGQETGVPVIACVIHGPSFKMWLLFTSQASCSKTPNPTGIRKRALFQRTLRHCLLPVTPIHTKKPCLTPASRNSSSRQASSTSSLFPTPASSITLLSSTDSSRSTSNGHRWRLIQPVHGDVVS